MSIRKEDDFTKLLRMSRGIGLKVTAKKLRDSLKNNTKGLKGVIKGKKYARTFFVANIICVDDNRLLTDEEIATLFLDYLYDESSAATALFFNPFLDRIWNILRKKVDMIPDDKLEDLYFYCKRVASRKTINDIDRKMAKRGL
ncbi:MAG TPA: hypothetical protein P5056_02715 [Candidatus Paceibacterota bacterium]|nr:hypothetical protein [Candidatus Paceibacterota bacterium]